MAEPQAISTEEYWVDYTQVDEKGNPKVYMREPPDEPGFFGIGGRPSRAVHVTRVTYQNGEIYDFTDDGRATYVRTDPQLATSWRAQTREPSETAQWSIERGADGRTYRVNRVTGEVYPLEALPQVGAYRPGSYQAPPGVLTPSGYITETGQYRDLTEREQIAARPAYIRQLLAEVQTRLGSPELTSAEHDQLVAERRRLLAELAAAEQVAASTAGAGGAGGGTGRTVFPWEREQEEAQTEYYRAQTEKIRRELEPKYGRMLQDYYDSVRQIQGMIERGDMTPAEADAYMERFRANMEAALRGTTPFEQQRAQEQEKRQRAEIGRDILNQRLTTGTSLATSLLSGFQQALPYLGAGLPRGETLTFDPFAIARSFTTEMQGGQEVGDLARALLGQLGPAGPTVPTSGGPQTEQIPQAGGGAAGSLLGARLALDLAREADERAMASAAR